MKTFLLDSNHLSALLHKVSPLRDRLHQTRRQGHRFVTCIPVLCELEVAIQRSTRQLENRRRLAQVLRRVRLRQQDTETTRHYGSIFHECRGKGRVLSQVDMMVAALARQHRFIVLTTDHDFEAVTDIEVEDWVAG